LVRLATLPDRRAPARLFAAGWRGIAGQGGEVALVPASVARRQPGRAGARRSRGSGR